MMKPNKTRRSICAAKSATWADIRCSKREKTGRKDYLTPPPNAKGNERDDKPIITIIMGPSPSLHAACFHLCCTMQCVEANKVVKTLLIRHVATEATRRVLGCGRGRLRVVSCIGGIGIVVPNRALAHKTCSCRGCLGVIVVETSWLQDVHW